MLCEYYTEKPFAVYLESKFNWASCIFFLVKPREGHCRALNKIGRPRRVLSGEGMPSDLWFESFSPAAWWRTEGKSNGGSRETRCQRDPG